MPRADGRGPPGRAAGRRGRLGQEPARARVRAPRRRATARSSSTAPATRSCARPTGRSSRRSTSSRASTEPDELRAALGTDGRRADAAAARPAARVGELPAPVEADPDTERHRLHTAVADLLAGVSRARPVLLVLEDGHWADAPTLAAPAPPRARGRRRAAAAARHLPRHRGRRPGRAVGDARRPAPLRRRRAAAARRACPASEVTEFVRRAAGGELGAGPPELARAISELTGGNAFLVCELWRALVETGVVEIAGGAVRLTRPPAELGTPGERARGRQPAARAAARPGPATCSSSPRPPAREFELDVVRRAAGVGGAPSCSPRSTRPSAAG